MKERIFYHRSYRTLERARPGRWWGLLGLVLALDVLLFLAMPWLLGAASGAVRSLLSACGVPATVQSVTFFPPLLPQVPLVLTPTVSPSPWFSFASLAVAVAAVLGLPLLRGLPRPLAIYLVFLGALTGLSAAYFMVVPERFPNDIYDYSLLHASLEVFLWLLVPLVMALALNPLPGGNGLKLAVVLSALVYSVTLGTVRWAATLYLMQKGSVLFMATLFFGIGPFFEFVGVVTLYALYVNAQALRLARDPAAWHWLS